mmetsp:Transcript_11430/g.17091  ORF Transcript_11430/g.17091 Transcript_11430/m.17091 type:complete len:452 (-) Transcript_11430:158-1513(-)
MYTTGTASIVDPAEQLKMQSMQSLHGRLPQSSALMTPAEQMKLMKMPLGAHHKVTVNADQLKMTQSNKPPQQGWFLPDDKWGRFRFTKGAAKKGCMPTGPNPVWYCSKHKEEGKESLLPLSEFMPYGEQCGNPNDKENNKIWSKYMLSGCVYLCKKHADEHIAFMKQRREEVASRKKEEAMQEAKNEGRPGDYRKYKTPKKQDLSMKKLQNTLTNVLKKFSPKASIAVLMTHEDDPGNLASFHVGNSLDSFCSDAYIRSLFLLCGTRQPQGQHLGVLNQGHDLILQQLQQITKQYGLLVRQLQSVTRQQQVQNITKQYGLIVSQLQNAARQPGVLEASVASPRTALTGVTGVPALPTMTGVPGLPGVESHAGVPIAATQLQASQVQFVGDAALAEAKQREAMEKAREHHAKSLVGPVRDDKKDHHPGSKRQREEMAHAILAQTNPEKRSKQ